MRAYSGMLRLATLYLEFEFSANSNITTCRFSVWVLLVAILFIPNLCSMIPQINLIDSCHSNLSSLLLRAPKYGGVSLRFRKTRVIEYRCLWTKAVIYYLFDTTLTNVGGHYEI
jgi:hypothetical protein